MEPGFELGLELAAASRRDDSTEDLVAVEHEERRHLVDVEPSREIGPPVDGYLHELEGLVVSAPLQHLGDESLCSAALSRSGRLEEDELRSRARLLLVGLRDDGHTLRVPVPRPTESPERVGFCCRGKASRMTRAEWTYELPPITGDNVWLEEYLVYDSEGQTAGKVFAVLELHGRRWLGIERSQLPGRHDRRAVLFDSIVEIDHENTAIHLDLGAEEVEGALELDPAKGVQQGGEAARLTRVPPPELPRATDLRAAPAGTRLPVVATLAGILGTLALLAVFIFWGAGGDSSALPYFAVPGVLLAVSAVLGARPRR